MSDVATAGDGSGLLAWAVGALGVLGSGLGGFALTRSVSHGEDIKEIKATCMARAQANASLIARLDRMEDNQVRTEEKIDRILERQQHQL